MISPIQKHYCWYCGHLLDYMYESQLPEEGFFLTCTNHGKYFVTFCVEEYLDGTLMIDYVDFFDKEKFIDRVKSVMEVYYDPRKDILHLGDENNVLLPSQLINNQPEVMIEKIKLLKTFL